MSDRAGHAVSVRLISRPPHPRFSGYYILHEGA